jgi:hypothetical protein
MDDTEHVSGEQAVILWGKEPRFCAQCWTRMEFVVTGGDGVLMKCLTSSTRRHCTSPRKPR